jgi:hypothetical protein
MKTMSRRTTGLVVAGALGLGGLAVAAPALAGGGPFGGLRVGVSEPSPQWRGGDGTGGNGPGPEMGWALVPGWARWPATVAACWMVRRPHRDR